MGRELRNSERRAQWPLVFSLKLEASAFAGTDRCRREAGRVRMETSERVPVGTGTGTNEGEAEKVCRDQKLR